MKALAILLLLAAAGARASVEKRVSRHPDRKLATEEFYRDGRKVGVHRSWYPDGRLRSETEFEAPNRARRYRTWFANGRLSKQIIFKDGLEAETKIYRETGQIYLNRVVRDGRVYGLPGGKACARVQEGS